jgi:D-3-phosphoglycerate dehydrogenase / 2-oxoglutarate reductase
MDRHIKFIITDYMYPNLHFEEEEAARLGIDFQYYQLRNELPTNLLKVVADADIILIDQAQFTHTVIEGLKNCRLLLRHGIGYDNVDVQACNEKEIVLGYYPTFCVREVAEQTIMLIIACQRKLLLQVNNLRRVNTGGFQDISTITPIYHLEGKTLGIVGFGIIGQMIHKMLQSFGVNFLVHDPYLNQEAKIGLGRQLVDLDQLLQESDIVTVHVPLKKEFGNTFHMFDENEFRKMKPNAIFINTSRGSIVNLATLDKALRNKWIAGAAIDVFEKEPPDSNLPLLHNDRAICTPHLSWYSFESSWVIRKSYMEDVQRFLHNELPLYQINPQVTTYRTIA